MKTKEATKNSNNFENKMKIYSTLAIGVIAIGNTANAQTINYYDIPDTTVSNGVYNLDLNQDATPDFTLIQSSFTTSDKVAITPQPSNGVLQDITTAGAKYRYAQALNINAAISYSGFVWGSKSGMILNLQNSTGGHGNWQGAVDKYLGLKIRVSNKNYYGWVRLDVAADATSFTIKDFAYNYSEDQIILAGDKIVGIKENKLLNNISVYSNNKTLFIDLSNNITDCIIKLYNITGQEIKSSDINKEKTEISLDNISAGIYLISIYDKEGAILYNDKIDIK